MSRVGKNPIPLPETVEVSLANNNTVTVKGPKGELHQWIDPDLHVNVEEHQVTITRPTDQKRHKMMHGLYRRLVSNMVEGASNGYKISLELVGVGYKAAISNNVLELNLGYSHSVYFALPPGISATTAMEKGKNPEINLEGIDKQLIGQVAAKLKELRKPEPYKGKGVHVRGEFFRRKMGKSGTKK